MICHQCIDHWWHIAHVLTYNYSTMSADQFKWTSTVHDGYTCSVSTAAD